MEFVSPFFARGRSTGVLLLLLPLMACQSGDTSLTRFEDSPIIDSLLASAPHFVVNTDIEAEKWVATTRLGIPTDSLVLGRPQYMIAIGDSVYISDATTIFSVGADGSLNRKISRTGRGPGEFAHLNGLQYNGLNIFAKDQGRIQVFTEQFDFIDSFSSSSMYQWRFSVSSEYIFDPCPEHAHVWLVCARSATPPYAWVQSGKLLPVLDLPDRTGEEAHLITISPDGNRVAVVYCGLPYIFIYDDQFRHLRTIRFEGENVRNFEPVGIPGGAPPEIVEPGTFAFIPNISFLNSRYLVARAHKSDHYIFDVSEGEYQLTRKIIFRPINDPEERRDVNAQDFLLHGGYLYAASPQEEYVYGYEFDL